MSEAGNDFYIRLQTESRISVTQWRQWAQVLSLDLADIVDVSDEVCYPILMATRKMPPISFIFAPALRASSNRYF